MTPQEQTAVSSNIVRPVILLYLVFLVWLIAHLHSRGWTGLVVGYPIFGDGSLLSIPFTPGAEIRKYTQTVTALTTMRQYSPSFTRNEQVYPLRRPTVGWRIEAAPTPSVGHYISIPSDQARTGDVVYAVAGSKGASLLPLVSPFSRLPLAVLISAALVVSFASVSVGTLIVARNGTTASAILLGSLAIVVGVMLAFIVDTLFEFWRGVETGLSGDIGPPYTIAAICLLVSGSLIMHFCYIWPQTDVPHPWHRLALAYWLPCLLVACALISAPISTSVTWLAAHGLHYDASLIALLLAAVAGVVIIALRFLRDSLSEWIYRGLTIAIGLIAGSCLIHSVLAAWSTDMFAEGAVFVLSALASLTVLSQLLGSAAKVAHVYRRASLDAKRQLKAVVIGLLCLTAALILTVVNGGALFFDAAFVVHSSVAVTLLAAFPWCLRVAVDRFHLLGVERVFPRAAATLQGIIGYAIGEVGKDFVRDLLQERVGSEFGSFMYFAIRVTLCLVAARIPIGDWLLRAGKLGSDLDAEDMDRSTLDRVLTAPTEHDALEIAASGLCHSLACEGFAIYAASEKARALSFLAASGGPTDVLAQLEFSRKGGRRGALGFHHVHSNRVIGQEGRLLKALGTRFFLGVGEKHARSAVILFFGGRRRSVSASEMAKVAATSSVLAVRLRAIS